MPASQNKAVTHAVYQLQHGEPAQRRQAMQTLEDLLAAGCVAVWQAVPALLASLSDSAYDLRAQAVRILRQVAGGCLAVHPHPSLWQQVYRQLQVDLLEWLRRTRVSPSPQSLHLFIQDYLAAPLFYDFSQTLQRLELEAEQLQELLATGEVLAYRVVDEQGHEQFLFRRQYIEALAAQRRAPTTPLAEAEKKLPPAPSEEILLVEQDTSVVAPEMPVRHEQLPKLAEELAEEVLLEEAPQAAERELSKAIPEEVEELTDEFLLEEGLPGAAPEFSKELQEDAEELADDILLEEEPPAAVRQLRAAEREQVKPEIQMDEEVSELVTEKAPPPPLLAKRARAARAKKVVRPRPTAEEIPTAQAWAPEFEKIEAPARKVVKRRKIFWPLGKIGELVFSIWERSFEDFLGAEAGRPGPLERAVAQSRWLLRAIQATVGLRFILLVNFCDDLLKVFTSYVHGIYETWKFSRTVKRRLQRRLLKQQIMEMGQDLLLCRLQLSRLLCLNGFALENFYQQLPASPRWEEHVAPSFALKLVLETRAHLDEIRRDLNLLNLKQALLYIQHSVSDFLRSLVPNPLELLAPWKDFFILAFLMKYSRPQVEEMYARLVGAYYNLLLKLPEQDDRDGAELLKNLESISLQAYELELLNRLELNTEHSLEYCIRECRGAIRRLLYLLTNPSKFIYPRYWPDHDLLHVIQQMQLQGASEPFYLLELQRRLQPAVRRALQDSGFKVDAHEKGLQQCEEQDFAQRYSLQKQLHAKFI